MHQYCMRMRANFRGESYQRENGGCQQKEADEHACLSLSSTKRVDLCHQLANNAAYTGIRDSTVPPLRKRQHK